MVQPTPSIADGPSSHSRDQKDATHRSPNLGRKQWLFLAVTLYSTSAVERENVGYACQEKNRCYQGQKHPQITGKVHGRVVVPKSAERNSKRHQQIDSVGDEAVGQGHPVPLDAVCWCDSQLDDFVFFLCGKGSCAW